MAEISPIRFRYEGDGDFKATSAFFAKRADEAYVIGETYWLAPVEDRSGRSHRHLFAMITETYDNLSDEQLERWPTKLHLRKWATIKAGYYDCASMVAASKAEALRIAAFMRPIDEFSIVDVSGATVTRYRAKSLSGRAMDRKTFQECKDKILNVLAELISVTPEQLSKQSADLLEPPSAAHMRG